ncbi:sigma-70 family RNA polymerase sigma factor [Nocardia cyriacigeorgica]|uniref:Sigma-70 family RNA polymerase sigma factor n=1 Tax=Nocardia cyriacigeorgica TaxID=135487 RepID=A0A5R8NHY2_9NOCA|nr:sigma-70 family RNA polymerase sigma factor [Nocardia cyriacigeorgica]
MATSDEFDSVRNDPDPIRRGQRAAELIAIYQQRAAELARVRKAAIEEAHRSQGKSYTEIAELLGLTKGRVSQIRATAPPLERAFFGVGPVAVGIPRRLGFEEGRERSFFDAAYRMTQATVEQILTELALASSSFAIDPDTADLPAGDAVIVCGPKSAPIARTLLADDAAIGFDQDAQGWCIVDSRTGRRHHSPYLRDNADRHDIGYFSRRDRGRVIVHIAGLTSVGSLGVAHWLAANVAAVYDPGSAFISGIVECEFDRGFVITASRLLAGPYESGPGDG